MGSRRGADQGRPGQAGPGARPSVSFWAQFIGGGLGERRHSRGPAGQGRGERCCAAASGPGREGGEACRGPEGASPDPATQELLRGARAGGHRGPRGLGSRVRPGAGGGDGGGRGGSIRVQGHQALLGPERGPWGRLGAQSGKGRGRKGRGARGFFLTGMGGGGSCAKRADEELSAEESGGLPGERKTWTIPDGQESWELGAAEFRLWRESACLGPFKHFKVETKQTSALCLRSRHLLYFLLSLKLVFGHSWDRN